MTWKFGRNTRFAPCVIGGMWGKVGYCGSRRGKGGLAGTMNCSSDGRFRVFLGTYTPKLDDKSRLTLPAKYRDELAGGLMITIGPDHSLTVYPREEFAAVARRAAAASRNDPRLRAYVRSLASNTDEQRPDAQGRITLSAAHRKYAGLTKECVVIGSVNYLEIWDSRSWADYLAEHEENFSEARDEVLRDIL